MLGAEERRTNKVESETTRDLSLDNDRRLLLALTDDILV